MVSLTRDRLEQTILETLAVWHAMTPQEAVERLEPVIGILVKKDHDYGPGNLYKTGVAGIIVRMMDKATRVENLGNRQALVTDEGLRDTLYDLIGYALRGLMILDEQEGKEDAADDK